MPLTSIDEPGVVDAFGVCFAMEEHGRLVRCHVFRNALNQVEGQAAMNDGELLVSYQKHRVLFERLASNMFDAGHRNPWIEAFAPQQE